MSSIRGTTLKNNIVFIKYPTNILGTMYYGNQSTTETQNQNLKNKFCKLKMEDGLLDRKVLDKVFF